MIRLHDHDYFILEKKNKKSFALYSPELEILRSMLVVSAAGVPYKSIHSRYVSNKSDLYSVRKQVRIKEKGFYFTTNVIQAKRKIPDRLVKKYYIKLKSCTGKDSTNCIYEADTSIARAIFKLNRKIPATQRRWELDRIITKIIFRGKGKIDPRR